MKYVYVDMERVVREIIPEYVPAFPDVAAARRYSPDFLKKCLPVPDEVAVEQGMEYLPQENRFVQAIRFTGVAQVTVAPGTAATLPVFFSAAGAWEVTEDGGLTLTRTEDGLTTPPLDAGQYAVTVRLTTGERSVEQVISITAEEPEQTEADSEAPEPEKLAELEERLAKLEGLLRSLLEIRDGGV